MTCNRRSSCRGAFTALESVAALAILATAAVLAAQVGTWSLIERSRAECRLAAIEAADNILESVRAARWTDLTSEWAAGQRLPEFVSKRLDDATLTVRITPEPDRPRVKRVKVTIEWDHQPSIPLRKVTLVGLFAERSTGSEP